MAYFVNKSFAPEMKEYSFCKAPGPPGHFLNPVVSLQLASCVCKFPQLLIQPTTGGKYSGRKKKKDISPRFRQNLDLPPWRL